MAVEFELGLDPLKVIFSLFYLPKSPIFAAAFGKINKQRKLKNIKNGDS